MRRWITGTVVTLLAVGVFVIGSSLFFGAGGSAPVLTENGPPITGGTGQKLAQGDCAADSSESPTPGRSSNLAISGGCTLQELLPVSCTIAVDDFYAVIHRTLTGGRVFYMTLNVETYRGPGSFHNAQLYLEVEGGGVLARWTNLRVDATVTSSHLVTLTGARLTPEVGTGAPGAIDVRGTLQCAA
jgi:hypothetical protein